MVRSENPLYSAYLSAMSMILTGMQGFATSDNSFINQFEYSYHVTLYIRAQLVIYLTISLSCGVNHLEI